MVVAQLRATLLQNNNSTITNVNLEMLLQLQKQLHTYFVQLNYLIIIKTIRTFKTITITQLKLLTFSNTIISTQL